MINDFKTILSDWLLGLALSISPKKRKIILAKYIVLFLEKEIQRGNNEQQ